MAKYHHSTVLPWASLPEERNRSRTITQAVLAVFLLVGVIMPMIPVPEIDRNAARQLPPRFAKLLADKPVVKPPEPKVEKKEEPKPEEKKEVKKEEKKKEPEKKPEPEPQVDVAAKAREKASRSGLLAMADELDDLREAPAVPQVNLNLANKENNTDVVAPQPEMLTMKKASSGGIDSSRLTRATRPVRDLSARSTEQLDSPIAKEVAAANPGRQHINGPRTLEQIGLVISRYKGALTRMHSIALRKDPTIEGDVVLEIGIAAAGNVTSCKAVSSTFDAPDFISKIETKCRSFDFGPAREDMTINYPLNFIPLS